MKTVFISGSSNTGVIFLRNMYSANLILLNFLVEVQKLQAKVTSVTSFEDFCVKSS